MKILIFGGTSEAHELSDNLITRGIMHTLSVATKYGEQILGTENSLRTILTGRMDDKAIADLIIKDGYDLIIDATHPYATEVTANIVKAVSQVNKQSVRAVRLIRDTDNLDLSLQSYKNIYNYSDSTEAANALKDTEGNILLTTGSKELHIVSDILGHDNTQRLYVRVIPSIESIRLCEAAGIETSHIIAMQGPFDKELNKAIIDQYDIKHLLTKDSGRSGGVEGKIKAAVECGIALHIIARPSDDTAMESMSYEEVLDIIAGGAAQANCRKSGNDELYDNEQAARKELTSLPVDISLIGIGMGDKTNLTVEGMKAIKQADIIFGSKRLINLCKSIVSDKEACEDKQYAAIYKPDEILTHIDGLIKGESADGIVRTGGGCINRRGRISVAVVFSGDSGFNSGCNAVYEAISKRIAEGMDGTVNIYPGISSVSYLAAKIGRPYDEAYISSMHGKGTEGVYRVASHVRTNSDVYTLTSGYKDITNLGWILTVSGLGDCIITAAADLSYPGERIVSKPASIFASESADDKGDKALYTCHIHNPEPVVSTVAAGLRGYEFIRGDVPMTKEEVRLVTIDKLRLKPVSKVLDIGCGTGSVSIEIARLIPDGIVYAYDVNDEAVSLTAANARKHKLPNVIVRKGSVPDDIREDMPKGITHAFIGGNKGRLTEILDMLSQMSRDAETYEGTSGDKGIRVVINAITDKTRQALASWLCNHEVLEYEEIKMQISRDGVNENAVSIYSFVIV